jgi:hypothetical protein
MTRKKNPVSPYDNHAADADYYIPRIVATQRDAVKALKSIRDFANSAYKAKDFVLHNALTEAADPLSHCAEICHEDVMNLLTDPGLKKEKEKDRVKSFDLKHEAERIYDEILVQAHELDHDLNIEREE